MNGELIRGDALEYLNTMQKSVFQAIITSPQYNVGWDYAGQNNDRLPINEYLDLMDTFLSLAHGVLRIGGVLCVNVPQTIRPDKQAGELSRSFPLASWFMLAMHRHGYLLREPIVWVKSKGNVEVRATSTAIGAYQNPYLRPCHEMIIVASKDQYQIEGREGKRWPGDASAFGSYLELCKDVWAMQPGKAKRGEPLAFPDALVGKLLKLYTNVGDKVLDPFAGNGTTGRVALLHGRIPTLVERLPAYWPRCQAVLDQQTLTMSETYV